MDSISPPEKPRPDPFGDEAHAAIKFKTMAWWQTAMIMIAETISLGILSLPSVLKTVGIIPGVILIIGLGVVSTYTGYVLGQFKLRYPQIHTFADAGEIILGAWGREIFAVAQVLFLVFMMGSHILTFAIMLNVTTEHKMCTIIYMLAGMIVSLLCTLPRTMESVSYLSIVSFGSILAAVLLTMIGVGVMGRGTQVELYSVREASLAQAFGAVGNIIFAYCEIPPEGEGGRRVTDVVVAGHLAFFSFISEMKDPRDYPKALCALQISDTTLYLAAAVVIYRYTGESVASPALGSSTRLLEKIAYGIAIPTIVISGVINGHVAAKYIYVRIFRGSKHLGSRSWYAVGCWVAIITILWVIAWIIAEAIPVFNNLLGLISALFVSWFTYGISGWFWIHMNRGKLFSSWRKTFLTVVNVSILFLGATIVSFTSKTQQMLELTAVLDGTGAVLFWDFDPRPEGREAVFM